MRFKAVTRVAPFVKDVVEKTTSLFGIRAIVHHGAINHHQSLGHGAVKRFNLLVLPVVE